MKNFKKFLPVFALVLGLGLVVTQSAFKPEPVKTTGTEQWFVYTGSSIVDQTDPELYDEYTEEEEPDFCEEGDMRCAVLAEPQVINGVVRPDLGTVDTEHIKYQPEP